MIRQRGYTFRIRPTLQQQNLFRQWAGCRRLVWNTFLHRCKDQYQATGKSLSYPAMCKQLTVLKQQPDFSFLNACHSQALQQVLRDLCCAYVHFFAGRSKFPRPKSRKKTPHAFRIPQRVQVEGQAVRIPKAGLVPIVLHRRMEGQIKSATLQQEPAGKWTITFVLKIPDNVSSEMQPTIRRAIRASFITGFRLVAYLAAGLAVASALIAWLLIAGRARRETEKTSGAEQASAARGDKGKPQSIGEYGT